jgi:hypothetical protein
VTNVELGTSGEGKRECVGLRIQMKLDTDLARVGDLIGELDGFDVVLVAPIVNLQKKQAERGAGRGLDEERGHSLYPLSWVEGQRY